MGCASTQNGIDRATNTKTYSPLEIISQESQKALQAQQILTKYRQEQNQTVVTNTKERLVYDAPPPCFSQGSASRSKHRCGKLYPWLLQSNQTPQL